MNRCSRLSQILALTVVLGAVSIAHAATINVPGDYGTIQGAVDVASAGETIIVAAGNYAEGVTIPVGKDGLMIHGANVGVGAGRVPGARGAESIVDGGFLVRSDAVIIDGFTIQNGAELFGGGSIGGVTIGEGDGVIIRNNIFDGDGRGCLYPAVHQSASSSGGNLIDDNEMFDWCQGVYLNPSSGNTVQDNNMHDNVVGVGSDGQSDLTVQFNDFSNHGANEAVGMGTAGTGIVINNNNLDDDVNHYGGAAVDVERNFWGCEEGPGQAGCSNVGGSGVANLDFTPWLCSAYPGGQNHLNDQLGQACPPLVGACCLGGGTPNTPVECQELGQDECLAEGGYYAGDNTDCAQTDCDPLLVTFEWMAAEAVPGGVLISWSTSLEIDTVGFRVLRETPEKTLAFVGPMIPSGGNGLSGMSYELLDGSKAATQAVHYYIDDMDVFGKVTRHGPIVVERRRPGTKFDASSKR